MIKKGLRGSMIFTLLLAAIVSFVTVFAVSFHANDAYAADADNRKLVLTFEPNGGGGSAADVEIPTGGKYTLPTIEEIGFTAPVLWSLTI